MVSRDPGFGILADAFELLREADRMHRQFFSVALGRPGPCWEPPVDVIEGDRKLVIRVALPGVAADAVEVRTDGMYLHVIGARPLPAGQGDTIHRLEIPYGRFERRIALPPGHYDVTARELRDGCLLLTLHRLG